MLLIGQLSRFNFFAVEEPLNPAFKENADLGESSLKVAVSTFHFMSIIFKHLDLAEKTTSS